MKWFVKVKVDISQPFSARLIHEEHGEIAERSSASSDPLTFTQLLLT